VITLVGKGPANGSVAESEENEIVCRVEGPHPGYPATAKCINQATFTLLEESERMPSTGGVYSPGAAFRKTTLIQRLHAHGILFTVVKK